MIIKIFPYKKNLEYVKFLEKNFNENKNYCLIEDKTIIVNLIENNDLLGTICLLNNKDLMKFLESSNSGAAGSYIFRASKGVHIYNFTVVIFCIIFTNKVFFFSKKHYYARL